MIPNLRAPESQSLKPFLDSLRGENLHLVEIGCFAGHGTVQFLAHPKIARVTCIDMFAGGYDKDDTASSCDMKEVMLMWMANIVKADVRKPLELFAFQDSSSIPKCDIVYIDANHTYAGIAKDIYHTMKLSDCKCIAGHDYGVGKHPGVKKAVDELFAGSIETFPDTSWKVNL